MLKPNHVYIEVCHNQSGGLSLCVSNDSGGYRISGSKVGGCETLKCFEVNASELIEQIREHANTEGATSEQAYRRRNRPGAFRARSVHDLRGCLLATQEAQKYQYSLYAAPPEEARIHRRGEAHGKLVQNSNLLGCRMTTDITELAQSLKAAAVRAKTATEEYASGHMSVSVCFAECEEFNRLTDGPDNILALVEALEKAQAQSSKWLEAYHKAVSIGARYEERIAELESRTVKLPDGWQFEECEIEGCENGAIFSVGTGSRNIHLCDKCAHEPQNSRLKKSPLSKRLPFKMSAGIKVEAE